MSKKTEQINVAVTEALFLRAERLEKKTGIKPTEMGRVGLVEVLNRLEGGMPLLLTVSPDVLRACAEVYALDGDPAEVLRAAIPDLANARTLQAIGTKVALVQPTPAKPISS